MSSAPRVLILAGIGEARELCARLAGNDRLEIIASLAGRVTDPAPYPTSLRTGGFGGPHGLAKFLSDEEISLLVDCTHPFAAGISRNACAAAEIAEIPLARYERPPWIRRQDDHWLEFPDLESAIQALPKRSTVFAPLGTGEIPKLVANCNAKGENLRLIIRTIEPIHMDPVLARLQFVVSRPPYSRAQERKLFRESCVTCLVCRNSGGGTGRAKLDAAADLKLPVYLITQPEPARLPPNCISFADIGELEKWICASRSMISHPR